MENIALVTIKFPVVSAGGKPPDDIMTPPASAGSKSSPHSQPLANTIIKPGTTNTSNTTSQPTIGVKFLSAGLAACYADLITFPLDTAKVRLQIQGESLVSVGREAAAVAAGAAASGGMHYRGMLGTITTISREEGVRALYNGLVPGLQRQMAFASIRIGLYDSVKNFYLDIFKTEGTVSGNNVGLRILAGITTGAMAVSCAQPTDVVKVRMQAATKGNKRYTGCLNAYRTIAAQEGVRGLWKGMLPNIARNAIVNAAELVAYDMVKETILKHNLLSDNMPCHFLSAFGAGFCATVFASPVDVVKTRFMNSSPGTYSGAINCAVKMYREGGLIAFYKGFMPSFMRLGSWNIVMFVSFEQLKRFFMGIKESRTPVLKDVALQSNKFL